MSSTNGTYVNGEKCRPGVPVTLYPKSYVDFSQSEDEKLYPNVGFRIVLATTRPKLEDYYVVADKIGAYFPIS
jgi:pSer/pThr/pTyr-binding forkhead associated (FHA) protein